MDPPDPHKYQWIIRFRQTIGSGTWNWDSGWWSMRKDFGSQTANCDINLTQEDYQGNCLNEDDHEWGTYTYEILVLEYEDEAVWTEGEALDSNFLKRYKNGYKFWVPEHLPAPNGDEPGHDVWMEVPEEGPAELRAYYCLHSEYDVDAEEVSLITVDPDLGERASVAGPTEEGVGHGIDDEDEDGEFDGIKLYEFQESDPAGTWRVIFTAADQGGYHSPHWRTHDAVRMLPVNDGWDPSRAVYANNQSAFPTMATKARDALDDTDLFRVEEGVVGYAAPPDEPTVVRTGLWKSNLVYFAGHGITYGPLKEISVPGYWDAVDVTNDSVERHNKRHGDAVITRSRTLYDHHVLATFTAVAKKLSDTGDYYPFALLDDDTEFEGRKGLEWGSYERCKFVFFVACNSARTKYSIARVFKTYLRDSRAGLGFTRRMNAVPSSKFSELFWEQFCKTQDGRLVHNWQKMDWNSHLQQCYTTALTEFKDFYDQQQRSPQLDLVFKTSDGMRYNQFSQGDWDEFTSFYRRP